MPVRADAIGAALEARTFDVETRHLLAYAAGIDQTWAVCFDDADDGLIGPPQICVRYEWPLSNNVRRIGPLGLTAEESIRAVHVTQDSTFHRPFRPGERITVTGRIVDIRQSRAGTLVANILETRAGDSDEPIVTTWTAGIYRDVAIDGDSTPLARPEPLPGIPDGSKKIEKIFIPRSMPHVYTECADIWNPIHTERRVALAAGLPEIILHGTATWAIAGREMMRIYGGGDPRRLKRLHGRFTGMIVPGTTVTLRHRGDGRTAGFTVANAEGKEALSQGVAVFSD